MTDGRGRLRPRKRRLRDEQVTLVHGAGGKATRTLVEALFLEELGNPLLDPLGDSALLDVPATRLAFTTDAHVVQPLFFPGGDIGSLAVNGTVNDVAVAGARPIALSAAFVLEEGLEMADLRRAVSSMASAAREAGVVVAAGDTKVVERCRGDGLTITTAGIGALDERVTLGPERVRPGDRVLLSGTLGDHGMAVMIARGQLALDVEIESDTASVFPLVERLLPLGDELRWLRDPTRGGLATTLNELSEAAGRQLVIEERALPVREQVAAACEILGIDPLYVANEGKLVAVVSEAAAGQALAALRSHPLGAQACEIGRVEEDDDGLVLLETAFGGSRIVDVLVGDPLPRIC
ncbi:MAG: hydrogenase expression/formation protein HypE [Gaiellaceae bacterium]